ncbi:DUF6311 domain-containing protein [Sabulicella rubraurantiaca]|uniref:DUF6311 domain-containing protein n=1 Tax=Sabulicella rubraurantiaca TaxID=2811429 RepID=UPI001A962111|nr:DUF6311 domain-containing protein [Sabulicella rubraurantiaca]
MMPGQSPIWPDRGAAPVAALLGAALVMVVFGWGIVPPGHTDWMLSGTLGPDPVQYWLGWAFFRDDAWRLPPGLSPRFGMELGSSIFFTDSIPLLAFLFKALRPVLAVDQYWGIWLLLCGALQGLFGALALRRLGLGALGQVMGAGLLVLQPMLLNRMGGHFALAGQWLLLAGLWLHLAPPTTRRPWGWVLLAAAAALIHSYILPMVLALWLADAWRRRAWLETPLVVGAALVALWAAGFFLLRAGHGGAGYGAMQLDLLAPFDGGVWSALLPTLPGPEHPEVGGSYLGLGGLLLLPFLLRAPWRRFSGPLAIVLLLMLGFAVTHRPSVAGVQVTLLSLPPSLVELAGALRASERFFWPLAYALLLLGMAGLARWLGLRQSGLALAALLVVQAVDLRPGIARLGGFFPPTEARLPLRLSNPFWAEATRNAHAIRAVPAANLGPFWEEVAVLAARHGLATDAAYLARADAGVAARLAETVLDRLRRGDPEPGVIYVLRDEAALEAAREGMAASLRRVDGLWVVPPTP